MLLDSCGVDAEIRVTEGAAEGGLEVLEDAFRPRATRPAGTCGCAWGGGGLGAGLLAGWHGCGPPPGEVKNETSVCARIRSIRIGCGEERVTHVDETRALPRVLHDRLPVLVAPLEGRRVPEDEDGRLGTRERDVHTPDVYSPARQSSLLTTKEKEGME